MLLATGAKRHPPDVHAVFRYRTSGTGVLRVVDCPDHDRFNHNSGTMAKPS